MNRYQIAVPPNGDIMQVAADRMENVDGDLKFFQGSVLVGEARYWQAWTLIGKIGEADLPKKDDSCPAIVESSPGRDPGMDYVISTIQRLS